MPRSYGFRIDIGPFRVEFGDPEYRKDGRRGYPYRVWDLEWDRKKPVFQNDDYSIGTRQTFERAAAGLLSFFALVPGDTDDEYWDKWTQRQIRWRDERAEQLQIELSSYEEALDAEEARTRERIERRSEEESPVKQDWSPWRPPPMAGPFMGAARAAPRELARGPIYVDMDETLLSAVVQGPPGQEEIVGVVVRPGAQRFLENLSRHGPLVLLTLGNQPYARWAIDHLGAAAGLFQKLVTYERLERIHEQARRIARRYPFGSRSANQAALAIRPILPPGVVFDDSPVGTDRFFTKIRAVGIPVSWYIQVAPFQPDRPDGRGLEDAYREYLERFEKGVALAGQGVI
jgi:hypothetical protein